MATGYNSWVTISTPRPPPDVTRLLARIDAAVDAYRQLAQDFNPEFAEAVFRKANPWIPDAAGRYNFLPTPTEPRAFLIFDDPPVDEPVVVQG